MIELIVPRHCAVEFGKVWICLDSSLAASNSVWLLNQAMIWFGFVITTDFVSLRCCTPWLHSAEGLHVAQQKKSITYFPCQNIASDAIWMFSNSDLLSFWRFWVFLQVFMFSRFHYFFGFRLETCRLRFSMFRCWKAFQNGLRSSLQASTQTIGLAAGTKPGNGNENVGNAALRIFFVKRNIGAQCVSMFQSVKNV